MKLPKFLRFLFGEKARDDGVGSRTGPAVSSTPSPQELRKLKIELREATDPSTEAIARRDRSVSRLRAEGVPTNAHLPFIEDSTQAKRRSTAEVAERAMAVCIVALKGEGLEQTWVDDAAKKYGADRYFSPKERAFVRDTNPTQQDRIQFSWRYECLWVLLWALGYVDELGRPDAPCDVARAVKILHERDAARFVAEASMRPLTEILDEADLIYRYDWAVVAARLKRQPAPTGLVGGVVQERHYVLNWLMGYMEQEWDEISTDT